MNKYILILLSLTHAWCLSAKENWTAIPDWLVLPQGKEKLGNMHGDIAVSSNGDVYVELSPNPNSTDLDYLMNTL